MDISRVFSTAAVAVVAGTAVAVVHPAVAAATALADGVYRFEFAGIEKDISGYPKEPSIQLLAVRSACPPAGCVATAVHLDPDNPTVLSTFSDIYVYREVDGRWVMNPRRGYACNNAKTAGDYSETFTTDAQGQIAGTATESAPPCTPVSESFTAARQGDLPPGIEVPDPNTA